MQSLQEASKPSFTQSKGWCWRRYAEATDLGTDKTLNLTNAYLDLPSTSNNTRRGEQAVIMDRHPASDVQHTTRPSPSSHLC